MEPISECALEDAVSGYLALGGPPVEMINGWKVWMDEFTGWWYATKDGADHSHQHKSVVMARIDDA